ncbi:MAG TPA: hypothetical protein HA254_01975 [Candidatus Diapherotrites archaeon]|uniref:Uncharacterized protein n=1 Tax=Candidatus Iainarchaeum sp. TaxID=3101447 RepID=A0A7J4IX55_9ARCH|nr:hypothetical protein [Candidatus Diapherotrites archaeon]
MIGKAEWFHSRKYTGWGLSPKGWQGWAYPIAMALPPLAFSALYGGPAEIRMAVIGLWVVILALDTIDIMANLKKDEREAAHEAIAEGNVAWFMVVVLAIGVAFEVASSAVRGALSVDPFLLIALLGAVIVKAATNIFLERAN